jgi:opacity protein-like surface antigen
MKRISLALALATLAFAAPVANAQSDLGLKRVGAAIGFVDPENLGTTFSLGVFADHGTVTPNISLESRLDYWGQSDQFLGTETSIRDVALGVRGKYNFETSNPKIRPFLGAGLGVHFLKAKVTVPPLGPIPGSTAEASSTELGVDLGGGVSTPVSPKTDLLGETWFGIVDGANSFMLRVGLSYKLGS